MLVFEGGYAVAELGLNTVNVLQGFEQPMMDPSQELFFE